MPWGVLQNRQGDAQNGVTATLKNLDGSNATTWSAITGGSSSTASLTADVSGVLPRFVEGGSYTIDVPALGVTGRRVEALPGMLASGHEFDVLARSRGGLDIGQAGVQAPVGHAVQGSPGVALVAGTEYTVRAFIPRTMKIGSHSIVVRTAAGASDTVYTSLRDAAGNIIASGTNATGGATSQRVDSTGRKIFTFTTPVVVEGGETVHASILIPTFGGSAVGVTVVNPGSSSAFQNFGNTVGTQDAMAKTGQTTPNAAISASDTTLFAPMITLNDNWGLPLRAWSNPNLTSIAPFNQFAGLDQANQLSFSTSTVRVPGTRSARCLVRPGDVQPATSANGERCECVEFPGIEVLEDTFWYAWSTYLPSDFVVPVTGITGGFHWAFIAQWHAGFSTVSPPIGIDVRTDGIYANITTGELSVSGLTTSNVEAPKIVDGLVLGAWHDFVVRATWSMSGSLDIFYRLGTEERFKRVLVRRASPTTQKANGAADSAAAGVSTHIGFYRSAEPSLQNVVYQQGLRRGRSLAEVMGIFGDPVTIS
jgi:hypothetical protein